MSTQIFWQEQKPLSDQSTVTNVVIEDRATGARIVIHAVDEAHADEIGRQLLRAGFNA